MYQCQRAIAESSRIELIYPAVVEQSVCSFGNIAGDGSEVRDHEIQQRTIKLLLRLIKPETSVNWLIFYINVSTWYSFFLDVIVRLHSCVTLLRPFLKIETLLDWKWKWHLATMKPYHCQSFVSMTLWRPCWRLFFELIWKCCILLHVRCYMAASIVEWIVEW